MNENVSSVQKLIDTVIAFFVNYSFQVMGALIVLFLGALVGTWCSRLVFDFCKRKNVDTPLARFLASATRLIVVGFAVIIALGKFGISTAPLVAALSAAVFGASFALRAPLSNYGAGISIILSRPFRVGNTITVQEVSGVVSDITLAYTRLVNEDGVEITIPNNQVVGQIMHNSKQYRIVESAVGIAYDCDPELAIASVAKILEGNPEVAKTPTPQIGIQEFGDSSLDIGFRYWIPTVKYYQTLYAINLKIFKTFEENKITIPYPRRDIRILSDARDFNKANPTLESMPQAKR